MKKLFILFAIVMVFLLCIPCYAEETSTDIITDEQVDAIIDMAEEELSEVIGEEVTIDKDKYITEDGYFDYEAFLEDFQNELEGAPDDVTGENYFKRLWEFIWEHRSGIISALVAAGLGLISLLMKKGFKQVFTGQATLFKKQAETEKATDAQVEGYNEMVKVCTEMTKALETKTTEDEARDVEVTKTTAICCTMMKMMMAAYGNSRNIPEYVKTAINEAYYDLKQTLGDDDKLLETFEGLCEVKVDDSEEV